MQEDQGGRFLLVVGPNDVVQKRYVQLGSLVGALQVIESGIDRNDQIVVGELWRVSPGTRIAPQPATIEQ